ncbi:hypothetical protein [Trebonia sp.]|uniref:hypothetical protein n=1 Tax=Trebonia sp. TaxID=2767075 RepID=UPI0026184D59|nr:hypothetical protein [Trebonia sp.]
MSRVFRAPAVLAAGVLAGVLVALTGCATKGVPYQTPSSSAAPAATAPTAGSPTTPASPVPAAAGQLTGSQLQIVLLPQSFFPAGFSLSSAGAVTSGGSLTSSPAQYDLATLSCANFVNNLGSPGFGETGMAAETYVSGEQAYDQVIYQFSSPAEASAFVTGVRALAGRCAGFTATENGTLGTFSLTAASAPAVGGHPSLSLVQKGTISGSSVTLDTLLTASGVDVFIGAGVGFGVGAPASPAPADIVYNLMTRQQAAAVLG